MQYAPGYWMAPAHGYALVPRLPAVPFQYGYGYAPAHVPAIASGTPVSSSALATAPKRVAHALGADANSIYSGIYSDGRTNGGRPGSSRSRTMGAVDGGCGVFPYSFARRDGRSETIMIERRVGEDHFVAGVVWNAAKVFSQYLCTALADGQLAGKRILELGAGTGLAGLMAARLGASEVVLSDLPMALPLLRDIIALNGAEANVRAAELAWGPQGASDLAALGRFDLVLATDCTYTALAELKWTLDRLTDAQPDLLLYFCHERRWPETDARFEALICDEYDFDLVHKTSDEDTGEVIVFTLRRKVAAQTVAAPPHAAEPPPVVAPAPVPSALSSAASTSSPRSPGGAALGYGYADAGRVISVTYSAPIAMPYVGSQRQPWA